MIKILINLEQKLLRISKKNRFKIYVFILLSLLMFLSPYVPYANVFIDSQMAVLTSLLLFLFLFRISIKGIFLVVCVLLIISSIFLLLDQFDRAENLGNYIFNILLLQTILFILKPYGKTKS